MRDPTRDAAPERTGAGKQSNIEHSYLVTTTNEMKHNAVVTPDMSTGPTDG